MSLDEIWEELVLLSPLLRHLIMDEAHRITPEKLLSPPLLHRSCRRNRASRPLGCCYLLPSFTVSDLVTLAKLEQLMLLSPPLRHRRTRYLESLASRHTPSLRCYLLPSVTI